jgi:hypothetical protein
MSSRSRRIDPFGMCAAECRTLNFLSVGLGLQSLPVLEGVVPIAASAIAEVTVKSVKYEFLFAAFAFDGRPVGKNLLPFLLALGLFSVSYRAVCLTPVSRKNNPVAAVETACKPSTRYLQLASIPVLSPPCLGTFPVAVLLAVAAFTGNAASLALECDKRI